MARHRNSIPVYSCVHPERIIRRVSPREAGLMLQGGTVYWIARHSALRLCEPERESKGSQSSLSVTDMRVAAGEFGRSHTARLTEPARQEREGQGLEQEDFIERSQMKFQLWQEIH